MNPRVAVVVPFFNMGEFLPDALDSIRGCMESVDGIESVIVNDGSTDADSLELLDRVRQDGWRVLDQENRGLGGARNAGVAATSAPYILPLDADNRVLPAQLAAAMPVLDEDPGAGVVYGDFMKFGAEEGRERVGPFDLQRLLRWNYIDACALYRREIWERAGGYDEGMPEQGVEDWDLWLCAVEQGWRFHYLEDVAFDYRLRRDSMIHELRERREDFADTLDYVAKKHARLYRENYERLWLENVRLNGVLDATGARKIWQVRSALKRVFLKG